MKKWVQEMTWEEVDKAREESRGVALVPVGSTEQHGRHLVTGCDSFCAIAVAEAVAERTGAVIAPPLWFGWSPHHMWLPGTITLRPDVLKEVVVDIGRSLIHHGFEKIVIINGHRYANLPPLQLAAWTLIDQTKADVRLVDIMLMGDTAARELNLDQIGHGDEAETSHMLHIHPEFVRMDKATRSLPPRVRFRIEDVRVPGDRAVWTPNRSPTGEEKETRKKISGGISGDPTKATRQKGEKLHNTIVMNIIELIQDMKGK